MEEGGRNAAKRAWSWGGGGVDVELRQGKGWENLPKKKESGHLEEKDPGSTVYQEIEGGIVLEF